MKKKFDLIIFDLDGTLYEDSGGSTAAFPLAAVNLIMKKRSLNKEQARRLFTDKKGEMAARLGGKPTNTLTLLSYFNDISFSEYEEEVDRLVDVEGLIAPDYRAAQAVSKVATAYPVALFTTNNASTTERILTCLEMAPFFPQKRRYTVTTAGRLNMPRQEQVGYLKPSPEGFKLILKETGARDALMVGDSEVSDIRPAAALGLSTYKVNSPQSLYILPQWLGLS